MKQFLITFVIQLVLWFLATVICGMLGITLTFLGVAWFIILFVNVLLGMVINVLIGNV